jgi:hypothetical protein
VQEKNWELRVVKLISLEFHRKPVRVEKSLGGKLSRALEEFEKKRSFLAGQDLRVAVLPNSEFHRSWRQPNGIWIAELRYDNLIHQGEGPSEGAALVDAVLGIVNVIEDA